MDEAENMMVEGSRNPQMWLTSADVTEACGTCLIHQDVLPLEGSEGCLGA